MSLDLVIYRKPHITHVLVLLPNLISPPINTLHMASKNITDFRSVLLIHNATSAVSATFRSKTLAVHSHPLPTSRVGKSRPRNYFTPPAITLILQ